MKKTWVMHKSMNKDKIAVEILSAIPNLHTNHNLKT